jgi:predicted ATPase
MLTRLQIQGFKNLRDVDLHFGPFTCIAGRNGVGKSNLFDAITFLSDLASMPLLAAALKVRGTGDRIGGIENLFARSEAESKQMTLIAEMIVPSEVTDDYDRQATASATFLQYTLVLGFDHQRTEEHDRDPIYIDREELIAKPSSEAGKLLEFGPDKAWLKRHVRGPGNRRTPFIETDENHAIKLYGDLAKAGRPSTVPARKSPQTVLSGVNASSHPTALAARREMQSWRLLQLEPSALRAPDEYRGAARLSATGGHLPNTLMRIGSQHEVAEQLAELIPGIASVDVDSDDIRQQRTLGVTMRNRERYAASSLSDGTLRFLALAVLASDPQASGLICLEEPENGIHPQRIPEMLRLVRRLAEEVESDEEQIAPPLRQVIINTHSPLVVAELHDGDLLMAETLRARRAEWIHFKPLGNTWRATGLEPTELISKGELQAYLGPGGLPPRPKETPHRVRDRLTLDLFPQASSSRSS